MKRDIGADAAIDKVMFRPFEATDFDEAAELCRTTWCSDLAGEAERLASELSVATFLAASTWGCVAERGSAAE